MFCVAALVLTEAFRTLMVRRISNRLACPESGVANTQFSCVPFEPFLASRVEELACRVEELKKYRLRADTGEIGAERKRQAAEHGV